MKALTCAAIASAAVGLKLQAFEEQSDKKSDDQKGKEG